MNWRNLPKHVLDENPEAAAALGKKKTVRLASDLSRNRYSRDDKAIAFLTVWKQAGPKDRWPEPAPEYIFDKEKGWRLDWAWADQQVAVEVDGGQWEAHGGRHARDTDRVKCNTAVSRGWLLFHFSPDQLETDPVGCVALVVAALIITEPPW